KKASLLSDGERDECRGEVWKPNPDLIGSIDRGVQNKDSEQSSKNLKHGTPPVTLWPYLSQCSDLLHAGIEANIFILIRVSDNPDGVIAPANSVDGFFDHVAQHNDALIRSSQMFLRSVIDGPLTLLRYAYLILGRNTPPAVFDACIDARLIVFKPEGFHDEWLRAVFVIMRIESQPEGHRIRIVHRNPEADRMVGYAAAPRRGVPSVRWKYPVRKLRLRYARHMHRDLCAVAGPLP